MAFGISSYKCREISAYEAIYARRFIRLDWQVHGFQHMKLHMPWDWSVRSRASFFVCHWLLTGLHAGLRIFSRSCWACSRVARLGPKMSFWVPASSRKLKWARSSFLCTQRVPSSERGAFCRGMKTASYGKKLNDLLNLWAGVITETFADPAS